MFSSQKYRAAFFLLLLHSVLLREPMRLRCKPEHLRERMHNFTWTWLGHDDMSGPGEAIRWLSIHTPLWISRHTGKPAGH
ncbi:hypothetical protein RRF57_006010 [Xylaria bambusicola]|uniref:Secreted protein n=1 Tax=Xylaria bambusicola TaxID=326684 RepID=A0AAN7UDK8_9PEZI